MSEMYILARMLNKKIKTPGGLVNVVTVYAGVSAYFCKISSNIASKSPGQEVERNLPNGETAKNKLIGLTNNLSKKKRFSCAHLTVVNLNISYCCLQVDDLNCTHEAYRLAAEVSHADDLEHIKSEYDKSLTGMIFYLMLMV